MKWLKRWVLAFVAPKPLIGFFYLPRFLRDWLRYRRTVLTGIKPQFSDLYPCLTDWTPSTPFDPHYLYQGAWLARHLCDDKPDLHVDIGSSAIMLSVLSAQVQTVFVDYRPLRAFLPNLLCVGGSILSLPFADRSVSSLSCLHVLEHIGLGRYGDPIDPLGSASAAKELARVLAPGGKLYFSTPVGREQVCFNAHRVFSPERVEEMFALLTTESFALVDDDGKFLQESNISAAASLNYGCGLYVFVKT